MTERMPDYEKTFIDFWQSTVTNPDGSLNRDQVMRELHDYHHLLDEVPKAYDAVTGGLLSKPNTAAVFVANAVAERIEQAVADARQEAVCDLTDGDHHVYLSTACWHEAQDGNPEMHTACRATCKWCDQSCACPNHPARDTGEPPPQWVDQARDIARVLLAVIEEHAAPALPPDLEDRIVSDPALFWLRGEERPHGTWTVGEVTGR